MKINETKIVETEVELKSCPFCGSEHLDLIHISGEWGYKPSKDYVKCLSCNATGGVVTDENCGKHVERAIKKWNRRK